MDQLHRELNNSRSTQHTLKSVSAPVTWNRCYRGERSLERACEVWIEERDASETFTRMRLPFRIEIRNHSPSGFAWGYGGSGPAQLALALLVDALGDAELALKHYQDFKWKFVAGWYGSWSITAQEIREFVASQSNHCARGVE